MPWKKPISSQQNRRRKFCSRISGSVIQTAINGTVRQTQPRRRKGRHKLTVSSEHMVSKNKTAGYPDPYNCQSTPSAGLLLLMLHSLHERISNLSRAWLKTNDYHGSGGHRQSNHRSKAIENLFAEGKSFSLFPFRIVWKFAGNADSGSAGGALR